MQFREKYIDHVANCHMCGLEKHCQLGDQLFEKWKEYVFSGKSRSDHYSQDRGETGPQDQDDAVGSGQDSTADA